MSCVVCSVAYHVWKEKCTGNYSFVKQTGSDIEKIPISCSTPPVLNHTESDLSSEKPSLSNGQESSSLSSDFDLPTLNRLKSIHMDGNGEHHPHFHHHTPSAVSPQ